MSASVLPEPSKKKRAKNRTTQEKLILMDAVLPHYNYLFGSHNNEVTEEKKKSLWIEIARTVNACTTQTRTMDKIREQFRKLKSETKGKASKVLREKGKTGGGEWEEADMDLIQQKLSFMADWERKIVRLLGVVGIVGIEEGVDTSLSHTVRNEEVITESLVDSDFMDHNGNLGISNSGDEHSNDGFDSVLETGNTASSSRGLPTQSPRTKNKSKVNSSEKLLEIQEGILLQLKRLADASEERHRLKKYKMGLNINEAFPVEIVE